MPTKPYFDIDNEKKIKEAVAGIEYLLSKIGQDSKNIIGEVIHKLIQTQTKHDECLVKFTNYQEKADSLVQLQRDICIEEINTLKNFYVTLHNTLHNEETQKEYFFEICEEKIRKIDALHEAELEKAMYCPCKEAMQHAEYISDFVMG